MSKFKRRKLKYEHHVRIIKLLRQAQLSPIFIPMNSSYDNQIKYQLCKKLTSLGMFNTKVITKKNRYQLAEFIITNKGIQALGQCSLVIVNMEHHWNNADRYDKDQKYCTLITIPAFIIAILLILYNVSILWIIIFGIVMLAALLVSIENAVSSDHSKKEAKLDEKQFQIIFSKNSTLDIFNTYF